MNENREGGDEDPEEITRDPEYGRDRVGYRGRELLRSGLDVVGCPGIAGPRLQLVRLAQVLDLRRVGPWRKSRTDPTIGTRKKSATTRMTRAAPSTVAVAARPRDHPVFAITHRTGYSNTSAPKMPTKTTRKVSPIETNAAITPIAAATTRIVRMGTSSCTRRVS